MSEIELWKQIPVDGFGEHYEVSSLGRVRRRTESKSGSPAGRILKAKTRRSCGGHQQVALCCNGVVKDFYIHRLVLMAFSGPCPDGMQGCHNDGNPANNSIKNLRWDTPRANRQDAIKHGVQPRGSAHKRSKLTELDVTEIRKLVAEGKPQATIARQYQVSCATICLIVSRQTWTHIN